MGFHATLPLLVLLAGAPGPPVQVLLLDGTRLEGRIAGIEAGRLRLVGEGGPVRTLPLGALDRLRVQEKVFAEPLGPCLYLTRRDTLPVTGLNPGKEGKLAFHRPGGGGEIALEGLFAFRRWRLATKSDGSIHLDGPGGEEKIELTRDARAPTEFDRDLDAPRSDQRDCLYLAKEGKVIKVAGVITGLETGVLRFDFAGKERRIPFEGVLGAILAEGRGEKGKRETLPCRLHFRQGGSLTGRVVSAGAASLRFAHPRVGTITLPWSAVARLECARDRVLDLARAEPAALLSRGAFGGKAALRRNRTVDGNPLRIGGREFDRGLCLIPYHRISYKVPPGFTHFHAFLGIADETGGAGAAPVRILADERELFRGLLRGGEKAREIRLPLQGAASLTLEVDFGPRLHLGDHCVIAAPRLLALPEED